MTNQADCKIKTLQTDNGGEYTVTAQKFEYNCEFMKFHALIK